MPAWAPTKIRWVEKTLDTSTGASRVQTDAGPGYAKLLGNPEGPQSLFCEHVGLRAASWLGLPTLEAAVVDVMEPGLVTFHDGTQSLVGPCFVTRAVEGTPWGGSPEELGVVVNQEVLTGLIVLDTWLLNCDRFRSIGDETRRNTRNVFLSYESPKGTCRVVAMDHTHIFACGGQIARNISNIDRVRSTHLHGHFPEFYEHITPEAVRQFATRLSGLTRHEALHFMADMPRAWDLPTDVRGSLSAFLVDRASFLGKHLRQMLVDQRVLQPHLDLGG